MGGQLSLGFGYSAEYTGSLFIAMQSHSFVGRGRCFRKWLCWANLGIRCANSDASDISLELWFRESGLLEVESASDIVLPWAPCTLIMYDYSINMAGALDEMS